MSKTPEEMAMEYIKHVETARNPSVTATAFPQMQRCFLAGYKAAQDQLADASKVMSQWISVNERLPPDGAKVLLIVFGDIHYGWIDQSPSDPTEYSLYFSNTYIDKGHRALTHWMPIPSKPKYMSDYVEYEAPKEEK